MQHEQIEHLGILRVVLSRLWAARVYVVALKQAQRSCQVAGVVIEDDSQQGDSQPLLQLC